MNILSTNAYCSRYLTDWGGPDSVVKRLAIRLGVPAHPGPDLVFTGRVAGVEAAGDDLVVEVEFRAATAGGDHVTGSATLLVPAEVSDPG
jgi:hypothetical protein